MKNQKGITLVALAITIIVMIIIASISSYYGKDLIKQAKIQDLRTNMLLIQAETKKGLEETIFQKINLEEAKANNIIIGTKLSEASSEVQSAASGKLGAIDSETCYYLSEQDLSNMGLSDIDEQKNGYFIVSYNLSEITVEVINTNGYKGKYTLAEINDLSEEQ